MDGNLTEDLMANVTGNDSLVDPDSIAVFGEYGVVDVVVDIFIVLAILLSTSAALVVLKLSTGAKNLVEKLIIVQVVLTLLVGLSYASQVLRHLISSPEQGQSSVYCRLSAGLFYVFGHTAMTNLVILSVTRLISVLRPFEYEKKIAFNSHVLYVVCCLDVVFLTTWLLVSFLAQDQIKLAVYAGVCFVSFRRMDQLPLLMFTTVFFLLIMAVLLVCNLTLFVVYRRLQAKSPLATWDRVVNTSLNSLSKEPTVSQGLPLVPKKAPRRSVSYYGRASTSLEPTGFEWNLGRKFRPSLDESQMHSNTLSSWCSDSDLPSSLQTAGKVPMEEIVPFRDDEPLVARREEPVKSKKIHVCFMRRCVSVELPAPEDARQKAVRQRQVKRAICKTKLRILQERFSTSPFTKAVLAISFVHCVSLVPTIVSRIVSLIPAVCKHECFFISYHKQQQHAAT